MYLKDFDNWNIEKQIISTKRLLRKIDTLPQEQYMKIQIEMIKLFCL